MPTSKENIAATLSGVQEEIANLRARLGVLEERAATLEAWLAEEGPMQSPLPMSGGTNGSTPLASFLRQILSDGKPRSLQEISSLVVARGGLIREHAKPGRVVHFALLALSQHGDAERRRDRTWVGK